MADLREQLRELEVERVEETDRELGRGAYGVVVVLKVNGLRCAGKKLHETFFSETSRQEMQSITIRFAEECLRHSKLRHPNIVQFIGVYYMPGSRVPTLVLELMPLSLASALEEYPDIPSHVKNIILLDVSTGLCFLHDRTPPVIHRDLTANNVLLTESMRAKIADLGVARIVNINPAQMTATPGTPCYMPPEAFIAKPSYDAKLDVFSMGNLIVHVSLQEWPIPLMEMLCPDPDHPGQLIAVTEIDRRGEYLDRMGDGHPLRALAIHCLQNDPRLRPTTSEIVQAIEDAIAINPPPFFNTLEMLQRIKNLEASNTSLEARNTNLESQVKILEASSTRLEASNTSIKASNTRLEARNTCIEASNTRLKASNTSLEARNTNLESQVKILETSNTRLEASNTSIKASNTRLEARNTCLEASNTRLKASNTSLEASNTSLESQVKNVEASNTCLEASHTRLEYQVKNLEVKVTSHEVKKKSLAAPRQTVGSEKNHEVQDTSVRTNLESWAVEAEKVCQISALQQEDALLINAATQKEDSNKIAIKQNDLAVSEESQVSSLRNKFEARVREIEACEEMVDHKTEEIYHGPASNHVDVPALECLESGDDPQAPAWKPAETETNLTDTLALESLVSDSGATSTQTVEINIDSEDSPLETTGKESSPSVDLEQLREEEQVSKRADTDPPHSESAGESLKADDTKGGDASDNVESIATGIPSDDDLEESQYVYIGPKNEVSDVGADYVDPETLPRKETHQVKKKKIWKLPFRKLIKRSKPKPIEVHLGQHDEKDEEASNTFDGENEDRMLASSIETDKEGYIPSNYVAKWSSLEAEDWFFGNTSRDMAKQLLMLSCNQNGSFLVRNSETHPGFYSITIRDQDSIIHYRIRRFDNGTFYLNRQFPFVTIQDLVHFYKQDATGLCCALKCPCLPRKNPQATGMECELNRKQVTLVRKLGAGQYGEVWEGLWYGTAPVAIRILKPGASLPITDIKHLVKLHHPNLVQIYGACTKEEPVYIIMELMKHGNLLDYLRGEGKSLKIQQLISTIAAQVAAGMAYLERQDCVHGSLAARNILVEEHFVFKVTNFGMPRVTDAKCTQEHNIKWTAPEAALDNVFTNKSDVWSMGIVLYEIITYGRSPYPGMTNSQVLDDVPQGYRMPCPPDCPTSLYDMMLDCWKSEPAARPTFETLQWQLEDFFISNALLMYPKDLH